MQIKTSTSSITNITIFLELVRQCQVNLKLRKFEISSDLSVTVHYNSNSVKNMKNQCFLYCLPNKLNHFRISQGLHCSLLHFNKNLNSHKLINTCEKQTWKDEQLKVNYSLAQDQHVTLHLSVIEMCSEITGCRYPRTWIINLLKFKKCVFLTLTTNTYIHNCLQHLTRFISKHLDN